MFMICIIQRSSTRNSQNSVMSNPLLDSSIRTNRATELRLSKDMVRIIEIIVYRLLNYS